ncbi:hypothetical protein F444_09450 [Phytophthora nicotianae P1976]|uniref:Elicitin-like protein n=1 Tax=Phytophthora nicotianae P1976 TaxID=1317066 RepID=A0A081A7Q3_PHYNI|nr:hypothetical protein F444_09450 [Phytophthora nicotianae P1976]
MGTKSGATDHRLAQCSSRSRHFEFFLLLATFNQCIMRYTTTWSSVACAISAAILVLVPTVTAKACTSTELTQLTSVAATYSNSPDCAGSALDNSINSVEEICAGACIKLVRELQPDAPDCEFEGTNLGETMEKLVAMCDAASPSSLSSASRGSNSDVVITTDTIPVCTTENVTFINDINTEVSKSADCLGSAGAATDAMSKEEYCAENACVALMTDVEARLPNCTYSGFNFKQRVADALALCNDDSVTWPNATTPTPTTATLVPTITDQTPTSVPSAASQATDTPTATKSSAVSFKSNAHVVMMSVLALSATLAWMSL